MSCYDWNSKHKAFIKECSNKLCLTKVFIGVDNEKESIAIFKRHFNTNNSNRDYGDGFAARCKDCEKDSWRRWNGVKGVTVNTVPTLWKNQNGRCAICKAELIVKGPKAKQYNLDHNKKTGQLRELLCTRCNFGLGHFRESEVILQEAIKYIRRHKSREMRRL